MNRNPRQVRRIDGSLGLHELTKVFQLRYTKQQCEDVARWINVLLERTYNAAPLRSLPYQLGRMQKEFRQAGERKLEAAIWRAWGPDNASKRFVLVPDFCEFVLTFQMPLFARRKKDGWGYIDLVGVSPQNLPVVCELKVGGSTEPPLRMLMEAVQYGLAVRKAWNERGGHLPKEWFKVVVPKSSDDHKRQLDVVPLICMAPKQYWLACIGHPDKNPARKVPEDAWPLFHAVVALLGSRGFPVAFVQFDEGLPGEDGIPTVMNPQPVHLPV